MTAQYRLMILAFPVVVLSVAGMACGPIQATTAISSARESLKGAEEKGAHLIPDDEYFITTARYKYRLAVLYLEKSKELQGFSKFQDAAHYAQEARRLAQEAIQEMDDERLRRLRRKEIKEGRVFHQRH